MFGLSVVGVYLYDLFIATAFLPISLNPWCEPKSSWSWLTIILDQDRTEEELIPKIIKKLLNMQIV